VSFDAITLCVASQRMFVVVDFVMAQSGSFGYTLVHILTFKYVIILFRCY
jgi:hypothetical protein